MVSSAIEDRGGDDREFVGSLARGLAVISTFGRDAPEMTLSQVAARAGLTRATARRFLLTLAALGYVTSDGKLFRLAPKVLELGFAYLSSMDLVEIAMPFMEGVSKELNESCSASVLDGDDIVYVARVPTRRIMSVVLGIGARLPAHWTSMGRVLLAAQPDAAIAAGIARIDMVRYTRFTIVEPDGLLAAIRRVRAEGYALVDQELEEGLISMSVPIRNQGGSVLAAMNVSCQASRIDAATMTERFLPVLRRAADGIARALP